MRILLFITLGLLVQQGVAMSILDVGKVCVASEINAVITLNGEPVKNATVTRDSEWVRVGKQQDSAKTDEQGRLTMPALHMRSVGRSVMMMEIVANTLVEVEVDGRNYEIIYATKREADEHEEFGGKARQLNCELTDATRMERFDGASMLETMCTWK
jgi:hypothetical protein